MRGKTKKEEDEVIKWNVSTEVFQPTGEKGEAETNEREEGVQQMELYPQSGLMVIHNDKLNNKEQKQEVQGNEKTRQSETQRIARTKIKETVPNPKERGAREKKKINMITEDKRRPLLSREEGIDFYPQWST